MAIQHVQLTKIGGNLGVGTRSYRLEFDIHVDDKNDGPLTIHTDPKYPVDLDGPYRWGNDSDLHAFITDVQTDPVDGNPLLWTSAIDYANEAAEDEDQQDSNPFNQPAQYEWLFNASQRTIERDIHGKRIQNTAGDRFDEILDREDSQPVLKVTRNEPASELFFGFDLRDCTNRSPWLGAPRRTVKFQPPRAVSQFSAEYGLYYQKSYEFKFSDQTWRLVMLNQGLNQLTGEGDEKTLRRMKDGEGEDITEPYALDDEGKQLAEGEPEVWLKFDTYPEVDFPSF